MKKRYLALTIAGLLIGYIAKTNYWFEDERDVFFPITKEQLRNHAKTNNTGSSGVAADYQNDFFNQVKNRFNSSYETAKYNRQVAIRLKLMQTMAHYLNSQKKFNNVNEKEVKDFLLKVARDKNENIMVKRAAYINWITLAGASKQKDDSQLAADKNSRLIHLVSLSDEKLILSLTESNED